MFIQVRDTNDNLKLLNVHHIISVEPFKVKTYKIGEEDAEATKITSIGAMVSSTIVYDSIEQIGKLIENAKKI
ncbi:MAG: hypothetical protein ACI9DM_000230 [Cyclobacteriaceae bacterium]|jgi:hypothetical protein